MLSAEETARYSRHLRLPGFDAEHQSRLLGAKVLIIGMGGLGSPAALYLAAAGIGTLGLADFDQVELHNLQRQILHDESSIGHSKLASAVARLKALNSKLNIQKHPEGVTVNNAIELFGGYDIIIDGSDNFPTRYLNNDAAFFAKKPLIYGSVFQFEGQVSLFNPHEGGPCYRCLFPEMPPPGSVPNCDEAGVFGALCGIIGSYQALEAVKYITGIGKNLSGKLCVLDSLNNTQRTLQLKPDPACPLCGKKPRITKVEPNLYAHEQTCQTETATMNTEEIPLELDVQEAQKLAQNNASAVFLDVREGYEVDICTIKNALHIPMGEISGRLKELPKDAPLLVYCHHGMRSLRVTEALRAHDFPLAQSIRDGIHAWALAFEPKMQRY